MPDPFQAAPREAVPACLACGASSASPEVETAAMMMPRGAAEADRFTFVRCDACGLVYLDPRVPADQLGRYYADWYLCYRGPGAWGPFAPLVAGDLKKIDGRRVARVERHRRLAPGVRILDVGCGKPTFLAEAVRRSDASGVGTDFSDAGWTTGTGGVRPEFAEIQLVAGDLNELVPEGTSPSGPLSGGFDVVTMWHYLEHDYDPARTLRRVREIAGAGSAAGREAPRGTGTPPILVIEVPNHDSLTRRRHGAHWAGYHTPRHTALWTPDTMRVLLERTGWAPVEITGDGTLDPYVLDWMSRMERRGIDWAGGMAGRFPGFVAGMLPWRFGTVPAARRRGESLGVMTAVARAV